MSGLRAGRVVELVDFRRASLLAEAEREELLVVVEKSPFEGRK